MADITKIGTESTKESLIRTADNPSAQILRSIEVVEEHLREQRSRIKEIQTRHDNLVNEIRQHTILIEVKNLHYVALSGC